MMAVSLLTLSTEDLLQKWKEAGINITEDEAQKFRESSEPTACRLPMYTGPCKAAIPMWAFKYSAGKCVPFIYGGCKGNDNKFDSQKECEEYCRVMMRRGVSHGELRMV